MLKESHIHTKHRRFDRKLLDLLLRMYRQIDVKFPKLVRLSNLRRFFCCFSRDNVNVCIVVTCDEPRMKAFERG